MNGISFQLFRLALQNVEDASASYYTEYSYHVRTVLRKYIRSYYDMSMWLYEFYSWNGTCPELEAAA